MIIKKSNYIMTPLLISGHRQTHATGVQVPWAVRFVRTSDMLEENASFRRGRRAPQSKI